MALEAGAPGVDAAAVTTALVGLTESPADGVEPPTADGRPLVFASVSYDELAKVASAAPEDTPLRAADAAVAAASEAHAASEDPDKGEFVVTPALVAGLFHALAETDEAAYRESVTARRTIAFEAAKAAHEEAAAAVAAAEEEAAAAREAFETQAREHAALMEAWNQDDDEDDGPGPGPDPDLVTEAEEKANLAKDAATTARRAVAAARRARSAPAEATKTYVLAEDFFAGPILGGGEHTPENAARGLADLAAAGLPVKGVVNLARTRLDAAKDKTADEKTERPAEDAPKDDDAAATDAEEEDDAYPPLVAALMESHARAVAESLEFDAPARLVAVVPLDFPREEGGPPDAAALASLTAAKCGVAALAAEEYETWRAEADVVRVPGDYAETVTRALAEAEAEEARLSREGEGAEAEEKEAEAEEAEEAEAPSVAARVGSRRRTAMDFVEHRAYAQVLAGIPHERVTCAVVLDAMLAQACASACDPEDVERASDVAAAEAARVAVSAALGALKLERVPDPASARLAAFGETGARASRFGFGTVSGPAASLSGTGKTESRDERETSGAFTSASATIGGSSRERDPLFPDGDVPDPLDETERSEGARVTLLHAGDAAAALRSTRAPGAFAATLAARPTIASVVKLDPDLVEAKMAALAHAPGTRRAGMPPEPEMDDDARGARKTALAAFLRRDDDDVFSGAPELPDAKTTLAAAERRELMCAARDFALPAGVRGDHGDETSARRRWEPLTREAYSAAIGTCVSSTGANALTTHYHAVEDALIVTCHAAPHEERMDAAPYRVNRAASWCEFFGVFAAKFRERLESRARRGAREEARARRAADEEARRLETEASDLAALDPETREAREASDALEREKAEEARRAAEEEEAAAFLTWDGSEDGDDGDDGGDGDESRLGVSPEDPPSVPDEDGRRWVVDAVGATRRRRAPLVPMASVAYSVEEEASRACAGATRRMYPSAPGAAVTASPDGGVDVVVAGVRLGLRRAPSSGDGSTGARYRLVASLADQPGAAIVVDRAPEDPPAPPPAEDPEEEPGEGDSAPGETETEEGAEAAAALSATAVSVEEERVDPPKKKPVYVQYTSDLGLCVTVTTERVVMQSRVDVPDKETSLAAGARAASLRSRVDADADAETSRATLADGSTVRRTKDGSIEVLLADGNVARRDRANDAWIGTNARGIRWAQRDAYAYEEPPPPADDPETPGEGQGDQTPPAKADEPATDETATETNEAPPPRAGELVVPAATFVEPLSAATVIDPETRASVTSREDLTLVVEHPAAPEPRGADASSADADADANANGNLSRRSLVVHADGTRVCRDVPAGCLWRVEKEGFAATHADAVTKEIAADVGFSVLAADADGAACVALGPGGSLGAICADVSGLVAFVPGNAAASLEDADRDKASPLARARRALRAAAAPEGDPDVDGAFVFDLGRGAVRFVDEAARRDEAGLGFIASDTGDETPLGPSASRSFVGTDAEGEERVDPAPAAPAAYAFLARAHEFRAACAFAELDPPAPSPEPKEGEAGGAGAGDEAGDGEEGAKEDDVEEGDDAGATDQTAGDDAADPVAAEPSSATTASLATTAAETPRVPDPVAVRAPLVPPRVFVAYPDQDEYFEVLSERAFEAYRAERLADAACAVAAAPVAGPEAGSGVVSHTFLTPLRPAPAPPAPTHVPVPSPRRPVKRAEGPRAVPSMRVPSVPQFPAAPATLLVPRIAAVGTPSRDTETLAVERDADDAPARAFVFRQVLEYPALSANANDAIDRALRDEANASSEGARTAPESYLLRDVRSDAFLVAEQNLADRVVAARRSKEAAYAARRAQELAAEAEEARRFAEEALDLGIHTLASQAKVAPRGAPAPPRGPRPAFPPVPFFSVEEGREALRAVEETRRETLARATSPTEPLAKSTARDPIELYSDRRTLPPRRVAPRESHSRSGPLPPSVRLADPEPPPVARVSDDEVAFSSAANDASLESSFSSSRDETFDFGGDRTFRTEPRMDFTGKPRSRRAAPASYYRSKAPFARNAAHEDVEGNARRRLRTTSATLAETRRLERAREAAARVASEASGGIISAEKRETTNRFRRGASQSQGLAPAQFELSPAHVHFGRVLPGVAVKRRATLTNVSSDLGRFAVRQPSGSVFAVEHKPGMVSPGLAAQLKVVCRASRPGEYVGEATILTESQVFVLSLSAVVAGAGDAENVPNDGDAERETRYR